MNYKENLEIVYKDIIQLAVTLHRNHQTISADGTIEWINMRHPELPNPYKGLNGVLQAAYDRTSDNEHRRLLRRCLCATTEPLCGKNEKGGLRYATFQR